MTTITTLPTPPSRSDPVNFADRADTFLGALPAFGNEANAVASEVNADAAAASTSKTQAETAKTQAEAAKTQAEAAAASAVATANTTLWVSGTTYAQGVVTYSPITFLSYRRKTAGAGTTDPSADATNWQVVANVGDVTLAGVQTLTNKRISQRVSSSTTITSPLAWNSDSFDQYAITAQAAALTISADAGTPTNGQKMIFRFKDNGTARALTWTTGAVKAFRPVGVTLPTTTIVNKTVYVGCIYNTADSRWDAVAVAQEA
jgi:hypothetical protein